MSEQDDEVLLFAIIEILRNSPDGSITLTIGTDGNVYIDDGTTKYPRLVEIAETNDRSVPTTEA